MKRKLRQSISFGNDLTRTSTSPASGFTRTPTLIQKLFQYMKEKISHCTKYSDSKLSFNVGVSSRGERGFTALELLIVLGIIGILIAIALTGIDLSRKKARDNVRISDVQNIMLALQQYHDTCRQYPEDIYYTDPQLSASNGCPAAINWAAFVSGGIMPLDPDDNQYHYAGLKSSFGANRCTGYHIGADLEQESNKALETDDDQDSSGMFICGFSADPFDGEPSPDTLYDIMING